MPYRLTVFAVGLLAVLVLLTQCKMGRTSMGYQNRVFVFADSLVWQKVEPDLRSVFEKIIYVPHTERSFFLEQKSLSELSGLKQRMNLFFIGFTESDDQVSTYLKKILPAEFISQVEAGRNFYAYKPDLFAKQQIGLFMMARNDSDFIARLNLNREDLFTSFNQRYFERLEETMFDRGEQKDIEEYLARHFNWKVRVQHDYFVADEDVKTRFAWLRRVQPNRWISVWHVNGDSTLLLREAMMNERDRFSAVRYEGDIIDRESTELVYSVLNDIPSRKLVGVWRNDSLLVGGPFRTYVVPDKQGQGYFFVDISVMSPGELKKPYLDQLEVIANTFEILQ
jgi:hypothetical protein